MLELNARLRPKADFTLTTIFCLETPNGCVQNFGRKSASRSPSNAVLDRPLGLGVPTLFGIELNDMKSALHSWPSAIGKDDPELEAAATGALRELLYGASALPKSAVQEALGISYDSAENLLKELYGE